MRNIHMHPDQLYCNADHCVPGGSAEAVGARTTLREESHGQGPQDGSVPCCRNTTGSRETREQHRTSSRCCFRRYSALSGEDVSESLKVALAQKGITDDTLKTHLVLRASHISNFQLAHEEVRSVLITRQALGQGPMPLDIGALDAKGKGKGKGKNKYKGKAKDKPDAEVTCY